MHSRRGATRWLLGLRMGVTTSRPVCLGFGVSSMRCFVAFAVLMLVTSHSWAATVTGLQGQVLVNTGNGFQQVQGTMQVGTGARVIVNQGGQASIQYEDGCNVPLNPGQLYTIAAASPCATTQQNNTSAPNGLAIGAAVIGGTVGAVILLNGLNSASP